MMSFIYIYIQFNSYRFVLTFFSYITSLKLLYRDSSTGCLLSLEERDRENEEILK
jgi:hypothetical protein